MRRILPAFFLTLVLIPSVMFAQRTSPLPERKPAWEHTPRMPMDKQYHPVQFQNMLLVGCEHNNALIAFDEKTGKEQWRYYTNGPIRHAPITDNNSIYVGSDDGQLYCLDSSGKLRWKFRGGSSNRKVIAHERITSAWPISTQPLLHENTLYVVSGYWPVDGIAIHAIDPKTGNKLWGNDALETRPFGTLRVDNERLIISGHPKTVMISLKTHQLINEKPPKRPLVKKPPLPKVKFQLKTNNQSTRTKDTALVLRILQLSKQNNGYCLVVGLKDGQLIDALLQQSKLRILAVDPDKEKVNSIRQRFDDLELFHDHRLEMIVAKFDDAGLPPYFANLIVSENFGSLPKSIHDFLRPFGGALVEQVDGTLKISKRKGALHGTDDWPQEFHDAANTLASKDTQVKTPLGLLWYGGLAAHGRFYFDGAVDHQSGHGLNPQPVPAQIIEGRMILQGPGLLAAIDIYTGMVLWETPLPTVYTFGGGKGGLGIHSKKHPKPWAYEPADKFDVKPTHRCRASGFNTVSTPDAVYLCVDQHLMRFNPVDGKLISQWKVPLEVEGGELCWGGIRAVDDIIIATLFAPQDLVDAQAGHDGNGGDWAGDRMPMRYLVAVNRHTGKCLWSQQADWGYINRSGFAIGGGHVYAVDLLTSKIMKKFQEAGRKLPSTPPTVYAFDLKTGKKVWHYPLDVYAQNLVYSAKRDMLILPCRNLMEWDKGGWQDRSIDVRRGKRNKNAPGKMRAFQGRDGKVIWEVTEAAYHTPQILLNDMIIDRWGFTYNLSTGKRHERISPVTGESEIWSFRKSGCNHLVACENLVTWRCAVYDLANQSGVMKLTGMDAGCSPTLLPAGGLLNIPNFGTHHKRNRMTAMALIHRPQNELWTKYHTSREKKPTKESNTIKRIGYNFGAPGDRIDENGTLWLQVNARNRADLKFNHKEVQWVEQSASASWIANSGVMGVNEILIPTISEGKYTIRLYFAELESKTVGDRIFDVEIEKKVELRNFDIFKESNNRPLVRELKSVAINGPLEIRFSAQKGQTLLCGIELILE